MIAKLFSMLVLGFMEGGSGGADQTVRLGAEIRGKLEFCMLLNILFK